MNSTTTQALMQKALMAVKYKAVSLADAQVIALRALNGLDPEEGRGSQPPATAAREQEASATGAEPPTEFEKTFPDHIWLDAGEAMEFAEPGDTFRDLHEVTWSEDNATGFGVKYVRADRATPTTSTTGKEEEAFEQLCREHDIFGTAAARQCEVFWRAGKMFALTQEPIPDADEAFEALYKVSSRDPANREDLGYWRAGWVAGQRALGGRNV